MKKKLLLNFLLLVVSILGGLWSLNLFDPAETDYGRRHPFFIFALCALLAIWALKDILVISIDPVIRKYPKVHARLNSDFWTLLLGPVKDDK